MGYEKQIGIIVPSSGIVTEMVFHRYAPVHIGISTARVKFNYVSFSGLSDMMDLVSVAASDLCCVEPNIIVFSSISMESRLPTLLNSLQERHALRDFTPFWRR